MTEYFEPSTVGNYFLAHSAAMEPCATQEVAKSFAITKEPLPGNTEPTSLIVLRKIAERYSVGIKTFVVIEHEQCFEVRRLQDNESSKLFYEFMQPEKVCANYEDKAEQDILRVIEESKTQDFELMKKYDLSYNEDMRRENIFSYVYVQRRTASLASIRKSKDGSKETITNILNKLIEEGLIKEVPAQIAKGVFNNGSKLYQITDKGV